MLSLIGIVVCLYDGRDHRLRRPGVPCPGGVGRRVRVCGFAAVRRGRDRLPVGAAGGLGRGDAAGPGHRRVRSARSRSEPGGGDARRRGRDRAVRVPEHDLGCRKLRLACRAAFTRRARPGLDRIVPRAGRQCPEPGARVRLRHRRGRAVPLRCEPAPEQSRPTDARRTLERASRCSRRHQRRTRQVRRVRPVVVHRRYRRVDVRVQLRLRERLPVRRSSSRSLSSRSPTSAGSLWSRGPCSGA